MCIKLLCNHYLRNVWLGGLILIMIKYMKNKLKDDLENIDLRLMVHCTIKILIRTIAKYIDLIRNYPKVSGDLFVAFMKEYHLEASLIYLKDTKGSR